MLRVEDGRCVVSLVFTGTTGSIMRGEGGWATFISFRPAIISSWRFGRAISRWWRMGLIGMGIGGGALRRRFIERTAVKALGVLCLRSLDLTALGDFGGVEVGILAWVDGDQCGPASSGSPFGWKRVRGAFTFTAFIVLR